MSRLTRRQALGAAAGVAAVVAATGAAQALPARTEGHGADHGTGHSSAGHHSTGRAAATATPGSFDEVYLGRRIQGRPSHGGGHHGHGGGHGGYTVQVDGKELHVMQNADGTWISVINHYEPHPTPRAVARAAVVELQGAALVPLALS
ncbi:tyrosinase cofactor [Streptomyces sp. NPDC059828]|uniref:apotyrosinase chaperone MelC1 n=1 Tax=Streptomyces sp. NPDC059828 TaxID=3346965 RepID=UPI00365A42B4